MMVEKSKTTSGKKKERGINVRVVQEQKTTTDSKVRINHNFDKKTTKKSTKKTTASTKKTSKKTVAKKKKPVAKKQIVVAQKNEEKVEIKAKKKVETKVGKKIEVKAEKKTEAKARKKIEVKAEKKIKISDKEKVEKEPEIKVAEKIERETSRELKKPASFSKNAEEFKRKKTKKAPEVILPTPEKRKSQIILRDVARNRDEIEKQPVKVFTEIPRVEKQTPKINKITEPALAPVVLRQPVPVQQKKLTAKEIKEQEIKKAISTAKKLPEASKKRRRKTGVIGRLGWARLTLMITCATTAIFALVYFFSMTSADVSLQVAASQSGINATYPDYVPRGYELSDVTSASGKVTMNFKSDEGAYMLSEEASSWNSDALLNNYVKENYTADEYSVVVEQGLTIYMGNNWEAWVNGGILYKLTVKSGALTKKQLKTIATSL